MLYKLTAFLAVASTVTGALAQTSTSAGPAVATHIIKVGYPVGQHAFDPPNTIANVGDRILFEMYPQNHSVVHMDPSSPCIPWDTAGNPENDMWWSGFYPVKSASNPGVYPFTVKTKDPIWFYCSAPTSCQKYQMVGVINAKDPDADLAATKKLAGAAAFSLSPGEKIPNESGQTDEPKPSTTGSPSTGGGGGGLGTGAIIGIVIGAIAALALVGLLFFLIGRQKKAKELKIKQAAEAAAAAEAANKAGEYPPMYQDPYQDTAYDPRYPVSPPPQQQPWGAKTSPLAPADHSNRFSELPSQTYDPVEIYTPGPDAREFPRGSAPDAQH